MPVRIRFPASFNHRHPPVRDVNRILEERITAGQGAADWVARSLGSWRFIGLQSLVLVAWVIANLTGSNAHWDPYPFILMNLVLSLQAAYAAPVIMMSQNRQAERDRVEAHNDFVLNEKAEQEIRAVLCHLAAQDEALTLLHEILSDLSTRAASLGVSPGPPPSREKAS